MYAYNGACAEPPVFCFDALSFLFTFPVSVRGQNARRMWFTFLFWVFLLNTSTHTYTIYKYNKRTCMYELACAHEYVSMGMCSNIFDSFGLDRGHLRYVGAVIYSLWVIAVNRWLFGWYVKPQSAKEKYNRQRFAHQRQQPHVPRMYAYNYMLFFCFCFK